MEKIVISESEYQKRKLDKGMLRLANAFKKINLSTRGVANAFAIMSKNFPKI